MYCPPGPTNNCDNDPQVPLDDDGCEPGLTGISPIDDDIGSDVAMQRHVPYYHVPVRRHSRHNGHGKRGRQDGHVGRNRHGGCDTRSSVVTRAGADPPIERGGEVV
ncbi:hypothetical protein Droror1_Dr00027615 [Drosera rotundifolia]